MNRSVVVTLSLILWTAACSSRGYEVFYGRNAHFDPGRGYHIDGYSRRIEDIYANEWFKEE